MATVGISRLQPHFPVPAVLLRTLSDCHKPHNKAIYDTLARQENFVCNRRFPFLPYCCVHSLIATNRITKPFMTLWQLQEYLVRNRTFLFLPYYCVHSPIATNRITMRFAVRSAPPFRYRTKRTNYSKGGIWSGTLPQAELEAAHSRKNGRHILSVPAVLFLSISRCQTAL